MNRKDLKRILRSAIRYIRFQVQNSLLLGYLKLRGQKNHAPGKVTIITPTYRRIEKLKEGIQCVLDQSYENWEQIIVSDGYDKDVAELVEGLRNKKIAYHYTFPLHVMGNYQRNYALKFATGEFVLYLDDDNIIYEDCLKIMTQGFTSEEIGYVVCPIHYGNGIKAPKHPLRHREVDLLNYMVRRSLVVKVWGQPVHGSADFFLIDKISRLSKGNYLNDAIVGHHR